MYSDNILECRPNPEFLIKSIAEQGYSLETAFADLIDNSISANADKIEILSSTNQDFIIYISDNGEGMDKQQLFEALTIPSKSIDNARDEKDLGRFGLGLKTASFSQTRELIVLSKKSNDKKYNGYSWDIAFLKETQDWTLKRLSQEDINYLLFNYHKSSDHHLSKFDNYTPNTIVIWKGLYKYETYLNDDNKLKALNSDLSKNVEEYISVAFHRFLEKGISIRLNNKLIKAFNPFLDLESIIHLPKRLGKIRGSNVKFESIVLPYKAIKESKESLSHWTTPSKGLMDMEGIYIYRGDRLISYGGWHNIVKRSGKLQLGRMKIDIGNDIDDVLKLNVAKSQIEIPFELKEVFNTCLEELRIAAQKEFYNVGLKNEAISEAQNTKSRESLFNKVYTGKGSLLYINNKNPLVDFLFESFDNEQKKLFKVFIKNINSIFNKNRQFETDIVIKEDSEKLNLDDIETTISKLRGLGLDKETIKAVYLSNIVLKEDINNIL